MSALIRTLVYRWLDEQHQREEEAPPIAEPRRPERNQQSLFVDKEEEQP